MCRRVGILASVVALLAAVPVHALPGDPPIAATSPKAGEAVPADTDGITVTFGCPAYVRSPPSELFGPDPGTAADYGAAFCTSPATGPDGRLAQTVAIGNTFETSPGVCQARLGSGGLPKPQATPGTYFWQAYRACSGCAGGYEAGPVTRFEIRASGTATLTVPARAYAAFPFVVTTKHGGSAGKGELQRQVGRTWRTVARFNGEAEPLLTLPRGRHVLRARFTVGTDTATSPVRTITVVPATRWTPTRRDDGAYRDPRRPSVRFTVTGGGRRITGFHADVPTDCTSSSSSTGLAPGIGTVTLPPVRIAPDGRFASAATVKGQRVRLTGRLVRGRLVGARARLDQGECAGSIAVEARRTSSPTEAVLRRPHPVADVA